MAQFELVVLIVVLYLIGLVIGFYPQIKAWFNKRPAPGPAQTHSEQGKLFVSYFNAVFPQTGADYLNALTDADLQQMWNSLGWYYLPLVQQIPSSRRAPLTNNSPSSWTQYFAADGADDGVYGDPSDPEPGSFFCSVFGGSIGTPRSEFTCYGQPYQAIQMIQMTGRRNGFPNNAYIEPVAFACESLGKSLLTAPACNEDAPALTCPDGSSPIPKCGATASRPATALVLRGGASSVPNAYAGSAAGAYPGQGFNFNPNQTRGSYGTWNAEAKSLWRPKPTKVGASGDCSPSSCTSCCTYTNPAFNSPSTICCYDDPSCCTWPTVCMASKSPSSGQIYDNYCGAPCTWQCDTSTGSCDWFIISKTSPGDSLEWLDWLKVQDRGSTTWVDTLLYECQPCVEVGGKCQKGTGGAGGNEFPDSWNRAQFESTMFYWLPGYGKFMNFGKTGVYFQYIHFLMTCPKYSYDGKQYMRWSFPQILQTEVLNQGNSELKQQLEDLTSGELTDEREYLEGYVITLTGSSYEGAGGTTVENDMKWSGNVGNTNGMVNPKDDPFLLYLDETTVTKYYSAADKVKNPQYKEKIEYSPDEAVALVAGAFIYGATGAQTFGYFEDEMPSNYSTGFGTWPFGTFFPGPNLGGCAYNTCYRLGWDSVQLTMMPTGMGTEKYCNYGAYDFELVFIGSKEWVCKYGMKMLDPTQDWDNYTKYGFVQGSGDTVTDEAALNLVPLDASKMQLTERNVPCCWGNRPMPNATHYDQPDPPIKDTSNCPYKDDVYRYIYDKGGNDGQPPSCG